MKSNKSIINFINRFSSSNTMSEYEQLLKKAYEKVKVVEKDAGRFDVPKVSGQIIGKKTIITNIYQIASYLRREVSHLSKFLLKELAVFGVLDKNRLILKTKLNSDKVNEKIQKYVKEFVVCPVCSKPDTEIISEKGIKSKHCLACGAKSPLKYHV